MYINVGNNKNIRVKNILGIFDADATTVSMNTRRYLGTAEKRGEIDESGDEIPKSFVVYRVCRRTEIKTRATDGEHNTRVCFSQFSPSSLHKRIDEKKTDTQ